MSIEYRSVTRQFTFYLIESTSLWMMFLIPILCAAMVAFGMFFACKLTPVDLAAMPQLGLAPYIFIGGAAWLWLIPLQGLITAMRNKRTVER